jgi:hypothetical protein
LGMCTGETRNEANKETGLRIALDYSGVCFHECLRWDEYKIIRRARRPRKR